MTFQADPFDFYKETTILRIDIIEEGAKFGAGDDFDCAIILEDARGHKWGVEYIDLEQFASFFASYVSIPSEDVIAYLVRLGEESDEDSIECSIYDEDIIHHFEQFRISEENRSKLAIPFNE